MTEEKAIKEYYAEIDRINNEEVRHNNRILNAVKTVMGDLYHAQVLFQLTESECHGKLRITKAASGSRDGKIFVHQTVNGGMTGDHFEGYIYIPLNKGKFLKSFYSM